MNGLQVDDLKRWSSNPEVFYHEFNTVAQTAETARGAVEALYAALLKVCHLTTASVRLFELVQPKTKDPFMAFCMW